MKNYKDETIKKLCQIINYLDDCGCLTDEDMAEYQAVMARYSAKLQIEEVRDNVHYKNAYILRDTEDGEIIVKSYDNEKSEKMMRDVSKHICFSDCDGTYEVIKIVYHGREVEYAGWLPNMVFRYDYVDTGDVAWAETHQEWDH